MSLRKRAAEHRKILGKNKDLAPVDQPVAGNNAIARVYLFIHSEICRAMDYKFVELLKTVVVEEKLYPFAGGHLAGRTLFFHSCRPAAIFSDLRPFAQDLDLTFRFGFGLHIG